jgi:hypothetical protein
VDEARLVPSPVRLGQLALVQCPYPLQQLELVA